MKYVHYGPGRDVEQFSDQERRDNGLATPQTIIEVCGSDKLMQEMYEYCCAKKIVGFDTETTGLDFFYNRIVLAQIGDLERQYLIWLDHTKPDKLLDVLRDPDIVKIGLNLKFDLTFSLYQFGMSEARAQNVVDVFLSAQVLMCGIYDNVGITMSMAKMETQARHWLGLKIPKDPDIRIGWEGYDPISFAQRQAVMQTSSDATVRLEATHLRRKREKKILYAADDVTIPIMIAHAHKPWIKKLGLVPIINLENRFLPVLADIETRGLGFDREAWLDLAQASEDAAKAARRHLDKLFDVEVTVIVDEHGHATYERNKKYTSPDQLVDMIRDWMWLNCGVDVIFNNQHFRESLERYGRLNPAVIERIFTPRQEPDPENPGKKKKFGYPKQKDTLEALWPVYRDFLPTEAFILPNTDSKTLKYFKVIYEAPADKVAQDKDRLPTTFGLPPELVDPILELRGQSKSASTYGRNWFDILSPDGRVHTNFRQCALSTGRISSTPNAQNFPSKGAYREAFTASPGYKMVGADYSQIEPRVIAHLSKDPTYMRVFWSERPGTGGFAQWCDETVTEPLDLYTEVGKAIGQIPAHYTKLHTVGDEERGIKPTKDGKRGRKQSKISNLGLGYGTGTHKFHYMICIDTGEYHTFEEVEELFHSYWEAMKVVKRYLDQSSDLTKPESPRKTQNPYTKEPVTYAETIMGRKRFFTPDNKGWWTQGRNMPIQGTAGGDMLKLAAIELTEWAWENNIDGGITNLIHDEILAEVRADQAPIFAEAMSDKMVSVGQRLCPTVPITATAYIADFWTK